MAVTPHDGSGTNLVFNGTTFTVSNVTINFSEVDQIDISHLAQTTGEAFLYQDRPLIGDATGTEISFDYIGANQLAAKTSGSFAITGVGAISGTATISSSTLTLALNDVVRGSATVRLTS